MRMTKKKPELLAPAGDLEKLYIAIAYGADAVYLSGTSFGLRAKAKNFNDGELESAIAYAHSHGVRVYVTANIFAHNGDIDEMAGYFKTLAAMGADGFIISDPGVLTLAREEAPDVEIHISTQANVTNYASARFWHDMGASRVILARELSVNEIEEIREKCPEELLLEGFVHGAMCMSYSGRCMLSRYMSGRDANLGACAHPCRYSYRLWAEEVSRPGRFLPVEENEHGTDIFGAEDLCMISHLPDLTKAGLESFKIEGRMKTAFYVGLATRAYRQAIDTLFDDDGTIKNEAEFKDQIPYYTNMLKMASHRPFSTGFYFDQPEREFVDMAYDRSHDFVGIVREYNAETGYATIEQRNVFEVGDVLTFVQPKGKDIVQKVTEMKREDGINITRAPNAKQRLLLPVTEPVETLTLVCREIVNSEITITK